MSVLCGVCRLVVFPPFLVEQVALLAALPSVMDVVRVHIGEFGVAKACLSFFSNLSVNEETLLPLMAALPSIQAIGVRYVAILIMVLCQCERKSRSRRGVVNLTPTYPHIPGPNASRWVLMSLVLED